MIVTLYNISSLSIAAAVMMMMRWSLLPRSTAAAAACSMSSNYSSGLNIVKSSTDTHTNSYSDYTTNNDDNNDPEEYVTNFYRQKRLEKRELAAKTVARSNGGDHHLRSAADHSLDHYFDYHDAIVRKSGHLDNNVKDGNSDSGDGDGKKRAFFHRSNISSGGSNSSSYDGIKNKRPAFLPNSSSKQQHARVASSVHGGSITQHVRSKHSSNSRNTNHYGSKKNNSGSHDSNSLLKTRGSVTHQSQGGESSAAPFSASFIFVFSEVCSISSSPLSSSTLSTPWQNAERV